MEMDKIKISTRNKITGIIRDDDNDENHQPVDDQKKETIEKNWDDGNINTLHTWIRECNKQQFIYEYVLDKIITKSKKYKVVILILCAFQSLISVSNLGINEEDHYHITWTIKVLLSVISAITYILTQIMTLEKHEDSIKKYTVYTDTIESFLSNMISTADVKISLRPDGDIFILENKDMYSKIYRDSPYISQSQWKQGMNEYLKYLENLEQGTNYLSRKRRLYDRYAHMDRNLSNLLNRTQTTK